MPFIIPYVVDLPFILVDGTEITIKGFAKPNSDRFTINLSSGTNPWEGQTVLHFDVRFTEKNVVRNHCADGWGAEERDGGFPFQRGEPYKVKFVVKNHAYKIFVGDSHFADFEHRMPKECVQSIKFVGNTQINDIDFSDAPVPFKASIPGGIKSGNRIIVSGIPTEGARFSVNLMCDSNIAFHFDARFDHRGDKNQVVRNSLSCGKWDTEEREQKYFPFAPHSPFKMVIQVEECGFRILVNEQHWTDFRHRLQPLEKINNLLIERDVKLTQVKIE